jgi:pimeloyl-ACP methyl ester carboxylesterase
LPEERVTTMAETIFMIHGICGGAWVWESYCSFFSSQGYRCVAATLRYHDVDPRAPPPPQLGTIGLPEYTADLVAEIDRLGEEPILMGHSMGGLLAQIVGSLVPAKAMVLLAPVPPAGILNLRPSLLPGFRSILTRWGWWKKPIRLTFEEAASSMLRTMPGRAQLRAYTHFVHESGRAGFEAGFWFLDPRHAARVDAARVTCPILALAGAQDLLAPAPVVRRIAQRYAPHATYHTFSNHAHWMVAEPGWQEVAAYILGWLDQVLEGR